MINPLTRRLLEKATCLRQAAYLTFTMIHPTDKKRRVPSRHLHSDDTAGISRTLDLMHQTNALGWGAYTGIAYRQRQLSRYQRGGKEDLLALPAIYADVDRSPDLVLPKLHTVPQPSFIIASGAGTHLYWILTSPTHDLVRAGRILKGMASWLRADSTMTVDQIMRLPGTCNTKPHRQQAMCKILATTSHEYQLEDFFPYEILVEPIKNAHPQKCFTIRRQCNNPRSTLNEKLSDAVLRQLERHYAATARGNGWYACYCPFNHRQDRFPGDHAYYRPDIGLFNCFGRHGQRLNHEIATALHIDINDVGGIYT